MSFLSQRLPLYLALIRLDKPAGSLLLLWPTLWALWLASAGMPALLLLVIFVLGTFLMRSAGCIANDYADRDFDRHVRRTADRPLTTGRVSTREAALLFVGLCLGAFALVLLTNRETVLLSFAGVLLAAVYPFVKRFSHFPQLVLGAAFAWGVPMAWTAATGTLPAVAWLVFSIAVVWAVIYDTFYAMVDRDDDIKVGIKSTAVLLGRGDRLFTAVLQLVMLGQLLWLGNLFELGAFYSAALVVVAMLFVWQQKLIRQRQREDCFRAFTRSHWVGAAVFAGIALEYFAH